MEISFESINCSDKQTSACASRSKTKFISNNISIASNAMPSHTCFWRHFVAKNLPSRFLHGDLFEWRRFFLLLLFDRSCRFPSYNNSKLSLSISSVVQSKKVGRDMNTHLHRRYYAPRQNAPLGPSHFLSKGFSRPALEVNRSSPKITGQDAHYGIASQYHRVSKSTKNSFQASCSGPLRAAKKQKKSSGLRRWRAGREQGHLLIGLRRPSSRSLVLIQPCIFFLRPLQLSRRPGNLFYLFTPVKTSQKSPRGVRTMGLAFKHACSLSCMQHTPACITCMHSRSTQITGTVTSIVVLRFARTPPPLCHSWKNSFPFVLGTAAESPESSSPSYPRLPRPDDRRSIPVTGSEGGGTVSAVDYEWSRQ